MPLRVMPRIEQDVTVRYLGHTASGVVVDVSDDGRSLRVLTEEGEPLSFRLSPATATFTTGGPGAPRLIFS